MSIKFPRNEDISEIFADFAGREVEVIEEDTLTARGMPNKKAQIAEGDPNAAAFMQFAHGHFGAHEVKIWTPFEGGAMNLNPQRLNARLEKGKDGKYRFSKRFKMG